MPGKIRGFSAQARTYVEQHPGLTAKEIFEALRREGKADSAARDPQGSLVATLHKYHREMGLTRVYDRGTYRYYSKGNGSGGSPPSPLVREPAVGDNSPVVRVRLTKEKLALLDAMMIANVRLRDRSDAVNLLVDKALSGSSQGQ